MTQEEFFLANQVDGQLTSEQMAQMLHLPEGDSGVPPPQSSEPAAAAASAPAADVVKELEKVEPEPKPADVQATVVETPPVVLARDGVHTIPYDKLVEAREQARVAAEKAAALELELDGLKKAAAPAQTPVAPAATPAEPVDPFGDYSEPAIRAGLEKMVAERTAAIEAKFDERLKAATEPILKQSRDAAVEAHVSAIVTAHPDAAAVLESQELEKWLGAQPSYVRSAAQSVLTGGTAAQVIELIDNFKDAGRTAVATEKPEKAAPDPTATAQAVIAKAALAPPSSLSEIPAGSTAHHDEAAAMLEMSSAGLMSKFNGKSPEQIRALMDKVL